MVNLLFNCPSKPKKVFREKLNVTIENFKKLYTTPTLNIPIMCYFALLLYTFVLHSDHFDNWVTITLKTSFLLYFRFSGFDGFKVTPGSFSSPNVFKVSKFVREANIYPDFRGRNK